MAGLQNSFEGIEEVDKAVGQLVAVDEPLSNEILAASRTMIAVYRPGFSYRPEQAIQRKSSFLNDGYFTSLTIMTESKTRMTGRM